MAEVDPSSLLWILSLAYVGHVHWEREGGCKYALNKIINLLFVVLLFSFLLPTTQMVFYIEACESGSMMENLPDDIDGELNFTGKKGVGGQENRKR